MRESLLSESPGRQNLVPKAFGTGFELLRYFQVSNEKLPAADEIFGSTKVLGPYHQAFDSLIPACYFVGMNNLGLMAGVKKNVQIDLVD